MARAGGGRRRRQQAVPAASARVNRRLRAGAGGSGGSGGSVRMAAAGARGCRRSRHRKGDEGGRDGGAPRGGGGGTLAVVGVVAVRVSTLTAALLYGPGGEGVGGRAWAELAAQTQVAACPTAGCSCCGVGRLFLVRARRRPLFISVLFQICEFQQH